MAQDAADKFDDTPKYGVNDTFVMTGADGTQVSGVVQRTDDDGVEAAIGDRVVLIPTERFEAQVQEVRDAYGNVAWQRTGEDAAEQENGINGGDKEALSPDSSERHLAEHRDGVPDLLPTQEGNASTDVPHNSGTERSVGKDTEGIANWQAEDVDENGHPFIQSSDGTTVFGEITEDSGLTAAPIKMSEGFNNVDEQGNNIGYGLLHIQAGHGKQILEAGYSSVQEFVEDVCRNYEEIRIGRSRRSNKTYMLLELHDEKHKRTLYVELSHDGTY